jgi:hypothetical protein
MNPLRIIAPALIHPGTVPPARTRAIRKPQARPIKYPEALGD